MPQLLGKPCHFPAKSSHKPTENKIFYIDYQGGTLPFGRPCQLLHLPFPTHLFKRACPLGPNLYGTITPAGGARHAKRGI